MSSAFALPRRSLPPRALRAARRPLSLFAACLALAGAGRLAAQNPGDRDTTFSSSAIGYSIYTQLFENVPGAVGEPFLLVGGDRDGVDLLTAANGAFDGATNPFVFPSFGSAARIVYTVVPEVPPLDGSTPLVLVGGQFGRNLDQFNAKQSPQNLKRLSPIGEVDATFNPTGKGANGFVTAIVPLADGGMIVGGAFDEYNGQSRPHLVRLDHLGALVPDSVFNPKLSFDGTVLSIATQVGTGQVQIPQYVVAGQFSNVSGATYQKLVRINGDGSIDTSFHPNFDDRTTIVVTQPDGKLLVGGDFETVNGLAANHIVRLNYDGTVDTTFSASVTGQPFGFIDPPAVYVIKLLSDGRMYLGGNFTTVDGVTSNYLARVNADGSFDTAFNPGKNIINAVQSITIQADGKLVVGETLSKKNDAGVQPPSLIRLYAESPTVTLSVLKATATENPERSGKFLLTRSGPIAAGQSLTVYLRLSPTAANRTNYHLGNKAVLNKTTGLYVITFPPGVDTLKLAVNPTGVPIPSASSAPITLTTVAAPSGTTTYTPGSTGTVTLNNH